MVGDRKDWTETYRIFSADGHYWRNLTLARIGILPYFVVTTLVACFWAKRLYGAPAGLLARRHPDLSSDHTSAFIRGNHGCCFHCHVLLGRLCVHALAETPQHQECCCVWRGFRAVAVYEILGSGFRSRLRGGHPGDVCGSGKSTVAWPIPHRRSRFALCLYGHLGGLPVLPRSSQSVHNDSGSRGSQSLRRKFRHDERSPSSHIHYACADAGNPRWHTLPA